MLGLYPARHGLDRRDVCPQPYKLGHKLAVTQQALMLWIVVLEYGSTIPSFADTRSIEPLVQIGGRDLAYA